MNRRLVVSIIIGAILGVFCIIGAQSRYDGTLSNGYLFGFWFNRILMGMVIGLMVPLKDMKLSLIRGAVIGLIVSFGFYSATEFLDVTGFLVGAVYGIIIAFIAFKMKAKE